MLNSFDAHIVNAVFMQLINVYEYWIKHKITLYANCHMETLSNLSNDRQIALLGSLKNFCRIFWGPDTGTCEKIRQGTFFDPFDALAAMIDEPFASNLQKIKRCAQNLQAGNRLHQHLEEAYIHLFINTTGGIKTPLYQSCYEYENAPMMGAAAIEMKKKFESRGLAVADKLHEPPDHLSIELEYLYFLLEAGWDGRQKSLIDEAVAFSGEDMIPWVSEFNKRLKNETNFLFYPLASALLISILRYIAGFNAASCE